MAITQAISAVIVCDVKSWISMGLNQVSDAASDQEETFYSAERVVLLKTIHHASQWLHLYLAEREWEREGNKKENVWLGSILISHDLFCLAWNHSYRLKVENSQIIFPSWNVLGSITPKNIKPHLKESRFILQWLYGGTSGNNAMSWIEASQFDPSLSFIHSLFMWVS